MGRIARCWIAEGFSKSVIVQVQKYHQARYGVQRTVGIDTADKVFFQAKVVKSRNDGDRLGGLENEFLKVNRCISNNAINCSGVRLTSSPVLMPAIVVWFVKRVEGVRKSCKKEILFFQARSWSSLPPTMDSIIELQRQNHEEIERFERALYMLLSRNQPTHESKLLNEHKASQVLDRISSRATALNNLYSDGGARKAEIELLSAPQQQNDLSEFYSRLVKIQEHHSKYPDATPGGFDLELAALLEEGNQDGIDDEYEEEDRVYYFSIIL